MNYTLHFFPLLFTRGLTIPSMTVKCVDDIKGQEYDVIILFNPRSYRMGFMDQPLSLKVAMTRARKSLILCGYFTRIMVGMQYYRSFFF